MVKDPVEHYGKLLIALVVILLLIMVYRMVSDGTWNPTPGPIGRYQAVVLPSGAGNGHTGENGSFLFQYGSSWFILDTATGKTYMSKLTEEGLNTWVQANKAIE